MANSHTHTHTGICKLQCMHVALRFGTICVYMLFRTSFYML